MIFPHKVMLFTSENQTDSDGNLVRRPATVGVASPAFVQAVTTHENLADPQAAYAAYAVFLPASTPALDAFSVVEWEGRRFELVGEALAFKDPHRTRTHFYARLRAL